MAEWWRLGFQRTRLDWPIFFGVRVTSNHHLQYHLGQPRAKKVYGIMGWVSICQPQPVLTAKFRVNQLQHGYIFRLWNLHKYPDLLPHWSTTPTLGSTPTWPADPSFATGWGWTIRTEHLMTLTCRKGFHESLNRKHHRLWQLPSWCDVIFGYFWALWASLVGFEMSWPILCSKAFRFPQLRLSSTSWNHGCIYMFWQ